MDRFEPPGRCSFLLSRQHCRALGGARPAEHDAIDSLFRVLTCASVDTATGHQAGDYLRHYGKSHGEELGDALIAAAAVLNRAMLWTRNRKHYPMKELTFF